MGRIMSIDFGLKRTGLATTDPLQLIVNGIDTVETPKLEEFLIQYFAKETVDKVVIGLPKHKDGNFTYIKNDIDNLAKFILRQEIDIEYFDEFGTSIEAKKIILQSGIKKKHRQDKALTDKISAVLILQKYLRHI